MSFRHFLIGLIWSLHSFSLPLLFYLSCLLSFFFSFFFPSQENIAFAIHLLKPEIPSTCQLNNSYFKMNLMPSQEPYSPEGDLTAFSDGKTGKRLKIAARRRARHALTFHFCIAGTTWYTPFSRPSSRNYRNQLSSCLIWLEQTP